MKKLIIAALLVVGISAFAQDKKEVPKRGDRTGMERMSPEQRNEAMLKRMTTQLNLNAQQQEQMKQVLAEQTAKREAMRAERNAGQEKVSKEDRAAMREKMMADQKIMQEKMKSILTPDQSKKWEEMRKEQQQNRGQRNWGQGGNRDGDRDGQGAGDEPNDN